MHGETVKFDGVVRNWAKHVI